MCPRPVPAPCPPTATISTAAPRRRGRGSAWYGGSHQPCLPAVIREGGHPAATAQLAARRPHHSKVLRPSRTASWAISASPHTWQRISQHRGWLGTAVDSPGPLPWRRWLSLVFAGVRLFSAFVVGVCVGFAFLLCKILPALLAAILPQYMMAPTPDSAIASPRSLVACAVAALCVCISTRARTYIHAYIHDGSVGKS